MVRHKFGKQMAVTAILLTTSLPAICEEIKPASGTTGTPETTKPPTGVVSPKTSSEASTTDASTKTSTDKASTDPATTTSTTTSTTPAETPKTYTWPTVLPPDWVPAKAAPEKPKEKPAPAGQAAAVKLYSQRKFAPAAAMFEKFIKDGTANSETHAYLAYCEYSQRHYTKALKQFDWVAKWTPNNYKLRTSAESSGAILRGQMYGICPQPCLKQNDPRWQRVGDHREMHWTTKDGWVGVTDHHVGQLISVKNDQLVNGGVCPTCGGTGRVTPLKDGDPNPH